MAKNPKKVSMCVGEAEGTPAEGATLALAEAEAPDAEAPETDATPGAADTVGALDAPDAPPEIFFSAIKSHSFPEIRRRSHVRSGSHKAGRRADAAGGTRRTDERRDLPARSLYHPNEEANARPRKRSSARFPAVGRTTKRIPAQANGPRARTSGEDMENRRREDGGAPRRYGEKTAREKAALNSQSPYQQRKRGKHSL